MQVSCKPDPELTATLIIPAGHLDGQGAPELLDAASPHIAAERPSLLLDLAEVDWMSSAGVGALIRLLARAQELGGSIALFGCGPRVRTILRVCGLEQVLNVRETGSEARDRLRELQRR